MANYTFTDDRADPARADTLTRRVYEALRDEIINGVLQPGDRLVRKKVAQRLGVSPMPVMEALYRLEVDGLVESRPLYGCRVKPLTLDDIENDLVLREAIECQAARLCAERASDADMARLKQLARQLDRTVAKGDPRSKLGMQLHFDLHLGIGRATGYKSLEEELGRVWFQRYMYLNWISATIVDPVPAKWHQRLMEGIGSREPARAEAAMREHVRHGQSRSQESLEYYLKENALQRGSGGVCPELQQKCG
jgi:DNA-binding GntR family transcriptional regulator